MVDRSDRWFRLAMRAVTRRTLLYTEMIPVAAALGADRERVLGFDAQERPLALQLGGDDPSALAEATRVATERGFDEIDLNCGCPSPAASAGRFGAVLMQRPRHVARCVAAMRAATDRPVTVKHRLGVDGLVRYEDLRDFVRAVADAGADRFIVHARHACLRGLDPRRNRTVPPLRPQWVQRLKAEHPWLRIEHNGGVGDLAQALAHLAAGVDGVMIGRAVLDDPLVLWGADGLLDRLAQGSAPRVSIADRPVPDARTRLEVLRSMRPVVARCRARGDRLWSVVRPLLGFAHGLAGARRFRRTLCEGARDPHAGLEVFDAALACVRVPADVRDAISPAVAAAGRSTARMGSLPDRRVQKCDSA